MDRAEQERGTQELLTLWGDKPFTEFLASHDLSEKLTSFVMYSIALLNSPINPDGTQVYNIHPDSPDNPNNPDFVVYYIYIYIF